MPDLLRASGLRLRTLAEVYGVPADEAVEDVEWLARAGDEGWPVLMKDDRIRYRPAERAAVVSHSVQAFCLTSGNLRAAVMAERFIAVAAGIAHACDEPGPYVYTVSAAGLRHVELG